MELESADELIIDGITIAEIYLGSVLVYGIDIDTLEVVSQVLYDENNIAEEFVE